MAKNVCTIPAAKLALYEALVATNPDVQRKGAKNPYTSWNGNMFSFMTQEGRLALRLPAEAREAFLKKHRNALCVQYGVVMKEYVLVPATLFKNAREAKRLFDQSFAYVSSLKPKATTRKKKAAQKKKAQKKKAQKKKVQKKVAARKKTASRKRATKKRARS